MKARNNCKYFQLIILIFCLISQIGISQTVGLLEHKSGASDSYTMISKLGNTYLIDHGGQVVHSWQTESLSTHPGYLMDNGDLMLVDDGVKRLTWEGDLVWEYSEQAAHHDVSVLPDGNVLLLIWGEKSRDEAIAAGRNPALLDDDLDPLVIHEVNPEGEIVWQWHVWDHLIQDFDSSKSNYGVVAEHPERVDINFTFRTVPDWLHSNAIDYHPGLDQIMISPRFNSEIWIIDHSTTTEEAASSSGGNSGKGGDLLYRWGNPLAYRAGTSADQQTFGSHDAHWIADGLPGAGNILLFNNGGIDYGRDGNYSTIDELTPPLNGYNYSQDNTGMFLPQLPDWTFIGVPRESFYSSYISSVQRLANGNTFIDEGALGHLFEVSPKGEILWQYQSPIIASGILNQGDAPPPERLGSLFRAYKYPKNHAGLVDKTLVPLGPIEQYVELLELNVVASNNHAIEYPETNSLVAGEGQKIPLIAKPITGYVFQNWTVEEGNAVISDVTALHTTLLMGSQASTVQANYKNDLDWIFSAGFEQ